MKIRYCTVKPDGAISWYRVAGVLNKLKRIDPSIKAELAAELNWDILMDTDILFLSNPYELSQYQAAMMAKELNVKIWIDYDDDVLNIPPTHPDYKYFSSFGIKENIWRTLEVADVVTVTTEALKESILEYNKNVVIIENAFNNFNYTLPDEYNDDSESFMWRGGHTHWDDLVTVVQSLMQISTTNPEWHFDFLAKEIDVRHITRFIPNSFYTGEMPLLVCFQTMRIKKPGIFIHPLVDNQFNRAKSNISWIEATAAGAMCIMPDLPEFCKPGVVTYKDNDGFLKEVNYYMKHPEARAEKFHESREYIMNKLCLSTVNEKRYDVIKNLFSSKKPDLKLV